MKYKDKKWNIIQTKSGINVYIKCECGFKHDISLDKKFRLLGRGTEINKK